MNKILYPTILFLFLSFSALAQTPIWGFGLGGPNNDFSRACRVSANGNVLVTGSFYGTMNLNPNGTAYNVTSNGLNDIFLACYSPGGILLWGFNIGGPNSDGGYNVTTDVFNNVYISGFFQGGANFNPLGVPDILPYAGGLGSTTEGDGFIAKYSSTGVFQWAHDLGGPTVYDYNEALGTDALGDVYVGGVFNTSMTISSSITFSDAAAGTAYLIKYDPTGNIVWGHNFGELSTGGDVDCIPRSMQVDGEYIYVCGFFQGTANFWTWGTPTFLTATGGGVGITSDDAFLAKYDTAGNLVFVKQIGGTGTDDEMEGLVLDASDNIYVNGFTNSPSVTFDFGTSSTSTVTAPGGGADYNIMMAKYSSTGAYQWGHVFGNNAGNNMGRTIDIAGGDLFTSGVFSGSVQFDPAGSAAGNLTSAGGTDMYLTKYDLNGNYLCGFRVGGPDDDAGYGLSHDDSGNIFISGQFEGTAINFNPSGGSFPLTSVGGTDGYIVKYNPTCTPASIVCNSITLPDSIKICRADTVTIPAVMTGTDSVLSYTWTPATGLSSTTILDPVLTATTSAWYYLTLQSLNPTELVDNGAFTLGNVGFTSSYTYVSSGAGELVPEDVYAIVTNPFGPHPAACSFGDHTTGTGNMMAINGASTPISVWCETIPVTPNTNYDFSAWVANWSAADVGTGVPLLQFQINGTLIGTADAITSACGVWVNFFATWNSGINTTANICIYDECIAADGNDFALDDISFKQICSVTDSVYILVKNPDTTHTHVDTSVCANTGSITIGNTGYISYLWSTGSTDSTIVVSSSGSYIVYDSSACAILADTFDVTYKLLDTTTTHVDTTVCANVTAVTLSASSGYVSYYWSTGSAGGSIVVSTAGSYWVDQTTNTCSVLVDTFDLSFKALPVVSLGNDTSFCQGDSLVLTSIQPSGDTLLWSTGSSGDSIHVTTSGTYSLTVSNGCVYSASITVTVSPTPLVNLGPDTSDCSGTPIVLQSSYTYTGATYLWSNTTTGATTTVTATGTYWLQVTVGGCSGSDTINVTILYDTFHLYTPDTAICKGRSVQVLATGNTAAQTYQWEPTAGIPNSTTITPIITPDTSATYAVFVFYPGCPTFVDSFHIDVQPVPIVYLGGNRSVCDHDTLHITASVTPQWYSGYIYSWSPSTDLDNTTMSTVVFTAGDTSELTLTVNTPAGCIGIDSAQIIVHTDSFVHYDTSLNLCPGDSVQLQPQSDDPGTTYIWHPAMYMTDTNSSTPWVFPLTTQLYWAVATSSYGCHDTVTANILVLPEAVLNLGDSVTLYPGQTYQLNPQTNCSSFLWFPPSGLSNAYISNPVADPVVSTKYLVYGTTEWGCKAVDSINIFVDPNSLLALPNAFTPGNGPNSLFKIIVNGEASLNYFHVYNRWGNLVYSSSDINAGWDGTYNGVPQPFDVYVYEIEAVNSNRKIFHKAGNVTLVR